MIIIKNTLIYLILTILNCSLTEHNVNAVISCLSFIFIIGSVYLIITFIKNKKEVNQAISKNIANLYDTEKYNSAKDNLRILGYPACKALIKKLKKYNSSEIQNAFKEISKSSLPYLIRVLKNPLSSKKEKKILISILGESNDKRAFKAILSHLNNRDSTVRLIVCKALQNFKEEEAVEPLMEICLNDENNNVRKNALIALSKSGFPKATSFLVERLNEDTFDKSDIIYSLIFTKEMTAVKPLQKIALEHNKAYIRALATEVLLKIDGHNSIKSLYNDLKDQIINALPDLQIQAQSDENFPIKNIVKGEKNINKQRLRVLLHNVTITREILLQDIAESDENTALKALYILIALGIKCSEQIFQIIRNRKNVNMVLLLYTSKNEKLSEFAENWFKENGYFITFQVSNGIWLDVQDNVHWKSWIISNKN